MENLKATKKANYLNIFIDVLSIVLILYLIYATFTTWKTAPNTIATHFEFNGTPNGYGSRNTLFILPPIIILFYICLSILEKYPHTYSYPVQITEKIKEKQYNFAITFIKFSKFEVICIFTYLQFKILSSVKTSFSRLSLLFFIAIFLALTFTIIFYIYKARKIK